MGIEVQTVKLLLLAQHLGVDFQDTVTIGRQDVLVTPQQLSAVFLRFGDRITAQDAGLMAGEGQRFGEALFGRLGASDVRAMDISDFEGATLIHDLNQPLPRDKEQCCSVVFDGGTLEHVFSTATALANLMAMPRIGGHLIVAVPSNNEMGHGFYQFSPEFFFRTLTQENGYEIEGLFLVPMYVDADWLAVKDPASVSARVGYNSSSRSTYIFVIAKRIAARAIFATMPQQSDYSTDWNDPTSRTEQGHAFKHGWKERVYSLMPDKIIESITTLRRLRARPDRRALSPFSPAEHALRSR